MAVPVGAAGVFKGKFPPGMLVELPNPYPDGIAADCAKLLTEALFLYCGSTAAKDWGYVLFPAKPC